VGASVEVVRERLGDPRRAAIILDVDGTLAPIAPRPDLAAVPDDVRRELARLVSRYALVAVVSGRPGQDAEALVATPGVRVVGLYGLEAAPPVPATVVADVRAAADPIAGAWVEPKGASVAVHVRQAAADAAAELRPPLEAIAASAGLELIDGKKVLELVPAGRPRKGGAVARLLAGADVDAALYAGDDVADVDAFEALRATPRIRSVCVAVRGAEMPPQLRAAADVVVEGSAGLAALLGAL
jgi:trehalose 6-phosphate phosphatase